jgi:hypothetical protein
MFLGCYWAARKETREEVALRMARFIVSLKLRSERFSDWYSKGGSRATAHKKLDTTAVGLANELRTNRRDIGGEVILELGFSFGAWNGKAASITATIGSYSPLVGNAVVLNVSDSPAELSIETWCEMLEDAITIFEPQHGVVTSTELLARKHAERPWDIGFLTYELGRKIKRHNSH